MNFALLGDDPAVLAVVRVLADHSDHQLTCAALVGRLQPELMRLVPGIRILAGWDGILIAGNVDRVLVCGKDEPTLEAAKQLASAGKSLVIFPRGGQGSTWVYELALVRDEGKISLEPAFLDRLDPTFRAIREAAHSGALGRLLYLQIHSEIHRDQSEAGPVLLSKTEIEDALLADVDLLRQLGGDYSRVTALHSGTRGDLVAAAGVTLVGDQLPEATWTARGTTDVAWRRLVVAGEKGEITATGTGSPPRWAVQENSSFHPRDEAIAQSEAGELLLRALDGEAGSSAAAEWSDLVRAFEIVDAARVSVRRRRTIDLHFETTSERNIFKSQMTAIGCLVLTLTLFGVVFLLLVMPLFDVRGRAQVEAEHAGSVLRPAEFKPRSAELEASGVDHVRELAHAMSGTHFPVVIEQIAQFAPGDLDTKRRQTVIAELKRQGVTDATERTQIVQIVGQWYAIALRIVRVLAFAPLALFLLLQLFILLARPGAK